MDDQSSGPEFSSDESFDDEDISSESDIDARIAEEDIFDEEFLKCYSALKKKDEKIYDGNVKFFTEKTQSEDVEGQPKSSSSKNAKEPKVSLLDHEINLKEDEIEQPELRRAETRSYYEKELDDIKNDIKNIGEGVDSDSDEDLLVIKGQGIVPGTSNRKTVDALLDKSQEPDDEDINHLKQFWNDPDKLTDEDKFLRDYILNKRYLPASNDGGGFFSKNLDELSDVEEPGQEEAVKEKQIHSEEADFDKIVRIPRNATKTYRDIVEKRKKREKRLKRLEKKKKRKDAIKGADYEDLVGDLPTKFHYTETEPSGLSAEELLMSICDDDDVNDHDDKVDEPSPEKEKSSKRKKKHKRGLNHKKFAKTGVAPDRLLAYGLSKTKLRKNKLL